MMIMGGGKTAVRAYHLRFCQDPMEYQFRYVYYDQSCVYDSQVDEISAAEVLHECLFGKWNTVEEEMLKMGQERLRELGEV